MKHNRKHILLKIIYLLFILAFVMYIFSNSLESKEESSERSTTIVEKVNKTLKEVNSPILISDIFARKSAHFFEFFILGSLLYGYTVLDRKTKFKYQIYICFIACLTAMTDETIQYFTKRGSMVLDVWLDFVSAALAVFLLYYIFTVRRKNRYASGRK